MPPDRGHRRSAAVTGPPQRHGKSLPASSKEWFAYTAVTLSSKARREGNYGARIISPRAFGVAQFKSDPNSQSPVVDELERHLGSSLPSVASKPSGPIDAPCVLVADDDQDLCDLLQRMLNREGFATIGRAMGAKLSPF